MRRHANYFLVYKLNDHTDVPYLAEEKENVCKGILGYDQCYNKLQTFKKYIPHGKHGLTVEFYQDTRKEKMTTTFLL